MKIGQAMYNQQSSGQSQDQSQDQSQNDGEKKNWSFYYWIVYLFKLNFYLN